MRSVTVSVDVDVDLDDAIECLSDRERIELLGRWREEPPGDRGLQEQARMLAAAIERGDGNAATDLAHKLCMELAGVPVFRPLAVGPAPWSKAA